MLPATVAVRVVIVGTESALIFSVLVAVALLKAVIVPELARFTTPLALLVIPVIVPVPLRLIIPVFVRLTRAVVIVPTPDFVIIPALARVVVDKVPPQFKLPRFVKAPAPDNAVFMVTVEPRTILRVPVITTLGITVAVAPLIVVVVPENVCNPVLAVKVVALLVKLPKKAIAAIPVSFQTPPGFIITSPVKVLILVPPRVSVPVIVVAPKTPNV